MWLSTDDYVWLPVQIAAAWILDLILGDPQWFPHPVRAIGRVITALERVIRWSRIPLGVGGVLLALVISGGCYLTIALGLMWLSRLDVIASRIVGTIMLYLCFATRCLAFEAKRIERLLRAGDLATARSKLALIVGRDTESLDEPEICRATVETVAENSADGVVTPMLYAFIGGPALAMTYKAVSTLDSMVGYKNDRYRQLGWASARLDDLVSLIPARLCMLLTSLAAGLVRLRPLAAFRIALRDGRKHPSPNAGIPEAAFAGALGVQLGGVSTYSGVRSEKPLIGDSLAPISPDTVAASVRLLFAVSGCTLVVGVIALMALAPVLGKA